MDIKNFKIFVFLQLIFPLVSFAQVASPTSVSLLKEKSEAFGVINGHYLSTLIIIEQCGQYPNLKSASEETARIYINENHALFKNVIRTFSAYYLSELGEKELHKFQENMVELVNANKNYVAPEVREAISTEEKCTEIMTNLRRGYWNLSIKRADEVKLILNNSNTVSAQSIQKTNQLKKPIPVGSKQAWRALKIGISDTDVSKLLGEPDRVYVENGIAIWNYLPNGSVAFDAQSMTVKEWGEPKFHDKVTENTPFHSYAPDNAGVIKRKK